MQALERAAEEGVLRVTRGMWEHRGALHTCVPTSKAHLRLPQVGPVWTAASVLEWLRPRQRGDVAQDAAPAWAATTGSPPPAPSAAG